MILSAVALTARFGFNVLFHQKDLGAEIKECWQ